MKSGLDPSLDVKDVHAEILPDKMKGTLTIQVTNVPPGHPFFAVLCLYVVNKAVLQWCTELWPFTRGLSFSEIIDHMRMVHGGKVSNVRVEDPTIPGVPK